MNIPKSYEALAADLASEKILSKTLLGQKEAHMKLADKGGLDLSESKAREAALREGIATARRDFDYDRGFSAGSAEVETFRLERDAIQQRLTVAEQREAEAREELLELSRKLDVFYSRSHGIKNLSEIEKANDKAKDLKLKVGEYEVLLNTSMELLTTISRHGATTKPVDWCDSFKAEVADRIEKIGSALKPAAEPEHVCKGCGSKGWTANCAQCVPY